MKALLHKLGSLFHGDDFGAAAPAHTTAFWGPPDAEPGPGWTSSGTLQGSNWVQWSPPGWDNSPPGTIIHTHNHGDLVVNYQGQAVNSQGQAVTTVNTSDSNPAYDYARQQAKPMRIASPPPSPHPPQSPQPWTQRRRLQAAHHVTPPAPHPQNALRWPWQRHLNQPHGEDCDLGHEADGITGCDIGCAIDAGIRG